jgi:hypothetical protein
MGGGWRCDFFTNCCYDIGTNNCLLRFFGPVNIKVETCLVKFTAREKSNPYKKVSIILHGGALGNIGFLVSGTRAVSEKFINQYIFLRVWEK